MGLGREPLPQVASPRLAFWVGLERRGRGGESAISKIPTDFRSLPPSTRRSFAHITT